MKHWRFRHVLQNQAGDGGSAGGAAAGAAAAAQAAGSAPTAGAGGGNGAAPGAGAGAGSALAAGAPAGGAGAGAAGTAAGVADPNAWISEKHRVFGQDGKTLDVEASARKVAEAYGHLEKRLGSGDVAPATVDGYKVNVPESFKDKVKAEDLAAAPGVKALLADLHAAGASQKIVDSAVGAFLREGSNLRAAQPQMAMAECEATLRQADGWKSDTEYNQQLRTAFSAGSQIFGKDFAEFDDKGNPTSGLLKDYGNDPRFIRGLASIGREMSEDLPPSPEAQAQIQENLDTLMNSPAYLNAAHPQHAATMAKVDALTKQVAGSKPMASGRTHSFKT